MGHAMRRAARGTQSSFDPLSLSPKGWWDASDSATVTLSGSNVTAWADKSGNGYTLTPGSAPTLVTADQNGRDVISFNGTSNYLTNAAGLFGNSRTCFVVCKRVSGTGYQGIAQSAHYGLIVNITNSVLRCWADNDALNSTTTLTSWRVCTQRFKNTATRTHETWVDGADLHTGAPGSAESSESLVVGGINFGGGVLKVAEILWYWSVLSDVDRQAVESYLRTKWGTP